jgi:3-hydroxyacyl-CoA dehydrogenase
VDAITGPTIGRPKTATFRLIDLVGLDVMAHVNSNLYTAVPDDPYRETLRPEKTAAVMEQMLAKKWLGNKSGQGFYKQTFVGGKREFWALNPETLEYEPAPSVRFDSIGAVRKLEDLGERLRKFLTFDDRAANYARDLLYFGFAYAAYVTPEIAYNLTDVDNAMRWGFAHEAGPFEMWDMLGVAETAAKMEAAGLEVAPWVKEMLAAGCTRASTPTAVTTTSTPKRTSRAKSTKTSSTSRSWTRSSKEVARNDSASLRDMGDGVPSSSSTPR